MRLVFPMDEDEAGVSALPSPSPASLDWPAGRPALRFPGAAAAAYATVPATAWPGTMTPPAPPRASEGWRAHEGGRAHCLRAPAIPPRATPRPHRVPATPLPLKETIGRGDEGLGRVTGGGGGEDREVVGGGWGGREIGRALPPPLAVVASTCPHH